MTGKTEHCIQQLQAVVDAELKAGTDPVFLFAALGEVAVHAAKADRETAAANLENLAAIVNAASQAMRGRNVMEALQATIFK